VYAGVGGARHVTTVDVGRAALGFATANWALNGLEPARHDAAAEDAFEFLEAASKAREK
jgi:23S rRNA (cytosine1962-C5)-methyltransferase